jgi:LEA14-like dessication related protein
MKTSSNRRILVPLALAVLFCTSCASKEVPAPRPLPEPVVALKYETIAGQDVRHLSLTFSLEVENPDEEAAGVYIDGWTVTLDGRELGPGDAVLEAAGLLPAKGAPPETALAGGEKRRFDLKLELNLERFVLNPPEPAGPGGDSEAVFLLRVVCRYPSAGRAIMQMRTRVHFPIIREPQVSILSIGIQKAELINTRFLVKISVNNPNIFPVDLSSFSYELYNRDRYWAGGTEEDVLNVPAKSAAEAELYLSMNFIGMKRSLLDEIITLRQVDYRFAGTALVDTGVAFLPRFAWRYDKSGRSAVTD